MSRGFKLVSSRGGVGLRRVEGGRRRISRQLESRVQMSYIRWLRTCYPGVLAVVNPHSGIKLDNRRGGVAKAMGYERGQPDVILLESRGGYAGFSLELKVKGGSVSYEQKEWVKRLTARGFLAKIMPTNLDVADAVTWAIESTSEYLGMPILSIKNIASGDMYSDIKMGRVHK